jgi:hypothetical protein
VKPPALEPGKRYRVHPGDASSAVRDIVYDVDTGTLEVEYASGVRYAYRAVPQKVFIDLFQAESVGAFVNTRIKRYRYDRL